MLKLVDACLSTDIQDSKGMIKQTIIAGNGIFEKQRSWIGTSVKKVDKYELGDEYPKVEESLEVSTDNFPKIPAEAIKAVIRWYKDITHKNGEEAQVNFYRLNGRQPKLVINGVTTDLLDIKGIKFWTDEIFSYTPVQNNSSAQTTVVKTQDKHYEDLNKYFGIYVETHSHNRMTAFRSSTDEAYSYSDGLQLVFGKLDTDTPEMYSWVCIRGLQKAGLSLDVLERFVEFPQGNFNETTKKYNFENAQDYTNDDWTKLFAEWDSQVIKTPVYTYSKTTTYMQPAYNQFGISNDYYYTYGYEDMEQQVGYEQTSWSKSWWDNKAPKTTVSSNRKKGKSVFPQFNYKPKAYNALLAFDKAVEKVDIEYAQILIEDGLRSEYKVFEAQTSVMRKMIDLARNLTKYTQEDLEGEYETLLIEYMNSFF